ncbi:MAG: tRNA pseudouridine(13) synthase TruD [Candidatus Methanoplasma sp.]|jgi:tRNA pseudouridine13 synthase|nr:tRNA pseudouridine(13) synthase TruD [Candidatus Methanoplasma sp.]
MSARYRECHTAEADIGMSFYISDTDGTGGRIKKEPEDFIVDEISDRPEHSAGGRFVIAEVTSRNWETNRLVRLLSRNIGMSREKVGFAGTKDKRAVTTQLMSFECGMDSLLNVNLKDVEIKNPYTAKRGIQIGDLIGNSFRIRVTECDADKDTVSDILDAVSSAVKENKGFPNYFGVQRFGVVRPITHKVGELIVRGDLEGAVRCYVSDPSSFEDEATAAVRRSLSENSDWSGRLLDGMPESLSFEKLMVGHIVSHPGDWRGAIGELPKNLQMMFVHAYQSYLFNRMLSGRMRRGLPLDRPVVGDVVIPLDSDRVPQHDNPIVTVPGNIDLVSRQVGSGRALITISLFGSESRTTEGEMGEIERSVIGEEGISESDFIVPGLPHCSSKGSRREILCPVSDLTHAVSDDGYEVSFSLSKGNYATCLMREYMKSEMNRY